MGDLYCYFFFWIVGVGGVLLIFKFIFFRILWVMDNFGNVDCNVVIVFEV